MCVTDTQLIRLCALTDLTHMSPAAHVHLRHWQALDSMSVLSVAAPVIGACADRPPLTTCSTPQTRKEMAGSRGYAAATPGVPLWSPLAPLLPPNELRLLDSTSAELGLDLPLAIASSAELALAEGAGPEDSVVAAAAVATAAVAGEGLPFPADDLTPRLAPANTMGSGIAVSAVLEGVVALEESGACAVGRSTSHCSSALLPAHISTAPEQASSLKAARSAAAEAVPNPPSLAIISAPQYVAAGFPGAQIKAASGGFLDLSVSALLDPSEASDRSAVQLPDDSETPRSVFTAAPAAETPAGCSQAAAPSIEEAARGAEQAPESSLSFLQPEHLRQEPALAEVQEMPMQLLNDDASALDLARNARTIASKAAAAPLSVDHPLVRQAALELSRRAAIEKATLQVCPSLCLTCPGYEALLPCPVYRHSRGCAHC